MFDWRKLFGGRRRTAEQVQPAQQRAQQFAWVGLDFGTATTKVVVRLEYPSEERLYVMGFDDGIHRLPQVIIPSAVEHLNGHINTGLTLTGDGTVSANLKPALIREVREGLDDADLLRPDGPFMQAALHLSSVLAVVRQAVTRCLQAEPEGWYLNIAAPLGPNRDDPQEQRLSEVFRRLGFFALEASATRLIEPALRLDRLPEPLKSIKDRPLPPANESPVTVVPEALAAVIAHLHRPDVQKGMYATIDIGGSTTDYSFFWFQDETVPPEFDRKAWYYAVDTSNIGTMRLTQALADDLSGLNGRTEHERLAQVPSLQAFCEEGPGAHFLRDVHGGYRQTFAQAFERCPDFKEFRDADEESRWELLLLGGGTSDHFICRRLNGDTPNDLIRYHRNYCKPTAPGNLKILTPAGAAPSGDTAAACRQSLDEVAHMLTVAYGLSFRTPEIPAYGEMEQRDPPAPPPPWQPRPDSMYEYH